MYWGFDGTFWILDRSGGLDSGLLDWCGRTLLQTGEHIFPDPSHSRISHTERKYLFHRLCSWTVGGICCRKNILPRRLKRAEFVPADVREV